MALPEYRYRRPCNLRLRDKYFAEFNFGYNGSENFAPGKRFGFFPSRPGLHDQQRAVVGAAAH